MNPTESSGAFETSTGVYPKGWKTFTHRVLLYMAFMEGIVALGQGIVHGQSRIPLRGMRNIRKESTGLGLSLVQLSGVLRL
jgi:hypothetical protein